MRGAKGWREGGEKKYTTE